MKATRVNYPVLVWQYDGTNADEVVKDIADKTRLFAKCREVQELMRKVDPPKQLIIEAGDVVNLRIRAGEFIVYDPVHRDFNVLSEERFKLGYTLID
jgi:6-phosphogluconate dehydrogenase